MSAEYRKDSRRIARRSAFKIRSRQLTEDQAKLWEARRIRRTRRRAKNRNEE